MNLNLLTIYLLENEWISIFYRRFRILFQIPWLRELKYCAFLRLIIANKVWKCILCTHFSIFVVIDVWENEIKSICAVNIFFHRTRGRERQKKIIFLILGRHRRAYVAWLCKFRLNRKFCRYIRYFAANSNLFCCFFWYNLLLTEGLVFSTYRGNRSGLPNLLISGADFRDFYWFLLIFIFFCLFDFINIFKWKTMWMNYKTIVLSVK